MSIFLNEAGARQKYVTMQLEKAKKARNTIDRIDSNKNYKGPKNGSIIKGSDLKKAGEKKFGRLMNDAIKYGGPSVGNIHKNGYDWWSKALEDPKNYRDNLDGVNYRTDSGVHKDEHGLRFGKKIVDYKYASKDKEAKDKFMNDFGGKNSHRDYEYRKLGALDWDGKYDPKRAEWLKDTIRRNLAAKAKNESAELFNEAADYVIGCINEEYDIDVDLLKESAEYILNELEDM